jgi:hypothetical protein
MRIDDANAEFGQQRDSRVRCYRLQTPHREVFDAALVRHGGKKQTHVRSAVWASEKPNMTKEVGNVMDEPGAHFRITRLRKMSASHPVMTRIANYLRENSSVKDYRMTDRWY